MGPHTERMLSRLWWPQQPLHRWSSCLIYIANSHPATKQKSEDISVESISLRRVITTVKIFDNIFGEFISWFEYFQSIRHSFNGNPISSSKWNFADDSSANSLRPIKRYRFIGGSEVDPIGNASWRNWGYFLKIPDARAIVVTEAALKDLDFPCSLSGGCFHWYLPDFAWRETRNLICSSDCNWILPPPRGWTDQASLYRRYL